LSEQVESAKLVWFRRIKLMARVTILALVTWGIWRTVQQARGEFAQRDYSLSDLRPGWLILAGLFYAIGLVPCWVFWHRTLRALNQNPQWRESLRAFWIGHLGKYVPGKALVVVLRAGIVKSHRVDWAVAAVSVFVETLTMMAVGAFVSAMILLCTTDYWLMALVGAGLMIASGVPTLPPVFRRIVHSLRIAKANPAIDHALGGLDFRLMLSGWLTIGIGWVFLGLSLWATLQSMPSATVGGVGFWGELPLLTASVGLAMVAGFLSLIPGGLGVRDWILMTLLAPSYGADVAVLSAVLLRIIWLVSELLISVILYLDLRRARTIPGVLDDGPTGASGQGE
jgi:uncharacterized membrane protein YbhN (UPF0104 family)